MKLNHIDLQVADVDAAQEFFERGSPPPRYPPDFHVGFVPGSASDVREAYKRLKGPDAIPIEIRAPRDNP